MLAEFTKSLLAGSVVRVGHPTIPPVDEISASTDMLVDFEQLYRLELPGVVPEIDRQAAAWAVTTLYLLAALTIYRDAGEDVIQELLSGPSPDPGNLKSHYAVDLSMRFLPDVVKLAKSAASDDPLIKQMLRLGRQWPLSSVGVAGIGSVGIGSLRTSDTLMRLYADRVLATGDTDRLSDPAVSEAVAVTIGNYPAMMPYSIRFPASTTHAGAADRKSPDDR